MSPQYRAELYRFDGTREVRSLPVSDIALAVRDGDVAAALLDVVTPDRVSAWWDDEPFPVLTQHRSFRGAVTSGATIGPTQRLTKEDVIPGLIDYFSYGAKFNERLRKTEFVKFCARELGADAVGLGNWGELPLVAKRQYTADVTIAHSLPPHCDCIHFGREPDKWPFKHDYDGGLNQISIFLAVKNSDNNAPMFMWNYRPESRAELDQLMAEYAQNKRIERLKNIPMVTYTPMPGQIVVLNTRVMHAVGQCDGPRQTVGSFLLWHDNKWKIFH